MGSGCPPGAGLRMRTARARRAAQGDVVSIFLAALLKPFFALVILVPVLLLADWIHRKMPDSRLKRVLFRPLSGHAQRSRWRR